MKCARAEAGLQKGCIEWVLIFKKTERDVTQLKGGERGGGGMEKSTIHSFIHLYGLSERGEFQTAQGDMRKV